MLTANWPRRHGGILGSHLGALQEEHLRTREERSEGGRGAVGDSAKIDYMVVTTIHEVSVSYSQQGPLV